MKTRKRPSVVKIRSSLPSPLRSAILKSDGELNEPAEPGTVTAAAKVTFAVSKSNRDATAGGGHHHINVAVAVHVRDSHPAAVQRHELSRWTERLRPVPDDQLAGPASSGAVQDVLEAILVEIGDEGRPGRRGTALGQVRIPQFFTLV